MSVLLPFKILALWLGFTVAQCNICGKFRIYRDHTHSELWLNCHLIDHGVVPEDIRDCTLGWIAGPDEQT